MQAPIAQAVALTIAGNRFLRGNAAGAFWPEASVFRYCKRVHFVTLSGPDQTPIAGTVVAPGSTVTITVNSGPLHPC